MTTFPRVGRGMEFIIKGDDWERRYQSTHIDEAIGWAVIYGYASKVYTVSEDGGKTWRKVVWDHARHCTLPAEQERSRPRVGMWWPGQKIAPPGE